MRKFQELQKYRDFSQPVNWLIKGSFQHIGMSDQWDVEIKYRVVGTCSGGWRRNIGVFIHYSEFLTFTFCVVFQHFILLFSIHGCTFHCAAGVVAQDNQLGRQPKLESTKTKISENNEES